MDEKKPTPDIDEQTFSWDVWLSEGLRAMQATLRRYDLGLPSEFWYHLERATHELLTAGRILLRTLRDRRHQNRNQPPEERGEIDIEWE